MPANPDILSTGEMLFTTRTGISLVISPLTLTARNAIMLQTYKTYPDPDPDDFKKVTNVKTIAGGTAETDGKDNPDYQLALAEAQINRKSALETGVYDAGVTTLGSPREMLLEQYKHKIDALRRRAASTPDDDWEAALKCLICEADEMDVIRLGLSRKLPLSQEEIADGRKFFRVELPGNELRTVPAIGASDSRGAAGRQHERRDERGKSGKGVGGAARSRQR